MKNKYEKQLLSVGSLYSETFRVYKKRWKVFLLVTCFPALTSLIQNLWFYISALHKGSLLHTFFYSFGDWGIFLAGLISFVLPVFTFILLFWSEVALILTIDDEAVTLDRIGTIYRHAWKKLGRFVGVTFWSLLLMATGVLFFIFPVFVFAVWFLFASYIVVLEDRGVFSALIRSKGYTKGYRWRILGRYLAICVPLLVISVSIVLASRVPILGQMHILTPLHTLLITPFSMIYSYLLYKNVKSIHPLSDDYTDGSLKAFLYILIPGLFLLVIFFFFLVGFIFYSRPIRIVSNGMVPNFLSGEVFSTENNLTLLKRGDVITFVPPQQGENLAIRRIIGLPGDKVSLRDGQVYVNNRLLDERGYLSHSVRTPGGKFLQEGQTVTVPNAYYFVLADNRVVLNDSRTWGFIARSVIKSKVTECLQNCFRFQPNSSLELSPFPSSFETPLPTFTCVGKHCSNI